MWEFLVYDGCVNPWKAGCCKIDYNKFPLKKCRNHNDCKGALVQGLEYNGRTGIDAGIKHITGLKSPLSDFLWKHILQYLKCDLLNEAKGQGGCYLDKNAVPNCKSVSDGYCMHKGREQYKRKENFVRGPSITNLFEVEVVNL